MFQEFAARAPICVLLVEDRQDEAERIVQELRRCGLRLTWDRVETREQYLAALDAKTYDLILSEYYLAQFSAKAALALREERGLDVPLIIVAEMMSDEMAVECFQMGAATYVLKNWMAHLCAAVKLAWLRWKEWHDRVQAEEALKMSEERYRLLVETAPYGIVMVGKSGVIELVNEAIEAMFGYTAEELIGQPLTILMPERLHTAHLEGFRRYIETLARHLPNWKGVELAGLRKDGAEIDPLKISFAEFKHGEEVKFVGYMEDISEQRKMLLANQALTSSSARAQLELEEMLVKLKEKETVSDPRPPEST